ncbi:unnamed protein product [Larinioides sclopetarius]|uniref:Uncharacterized protein n=1 Tax=Larinioides sclopetarius TaxID=280406 RepID=A0AAV2B7S2_9ARAC
MGNSLSNGFQNLPGVYLRDLRRKTRLRFRSILTAQRSGHGIVKRKDPDDEAVTELNTKSVAEYVIRNPDFLDDLVKKHIAQDRVRAWIKEPIYDDIGIIEAVDHEGNVEISAQKEAEEEEEEVYKSSSSGTREKEKGKESESSSRDVRAKSSEDLISKKFSKKILEILSTENEAKSEKKTNGDESTRDSEDKRDSDADSIEDKPRGEKHAKKSRGDSSFQQQIAELSFRQRKVLIITRGRLLYPEVCRQQELKALLERPDMDRKCRELESPLFPYTEIQHEDINKVFILMCRDLFGKYG